jgi:hypothetical protein
MDTHPAYYTNLLRRQLADDRTLSDQARQELNLHLLICLECNLRYLVWVLARYAACVQAGGVECNTP